MKQKLIKIMLIRDLSYDFSATLYSIISLHIRNESFSACSSAVQIMRGRGQRAREKW